MSIQIAILICGLVTLITSAFLSVASNYNKKDIINLCIVISLVFGIFLMTAQYVDSEQNQKQQDKIAEYGRLNDSLSRKIHYLSTEIKKLEELSITLIDSVKSIVTTINRLSTVNNSIVSTINKESNRAFSENKFTGELDFNFGKQIMPTDTIVVQCGATFIYNAGKCMNGYGIVDFSGTEDFLAMKIENNRLLITTKVYDVNGNILVTVNDNKWWVNQNFKSKLNYDRRGFEVIDNHDNVVFSIELTNYNSVLVNGIYFYNNNIYIFNGVTLLRCNAKKMTPYHINEIRHIPKRFEYLGNNWVGKRANQ